MERDSLGRGDIEENNAQAALERRFWALGLGAEIWSRGAAPWAGARGVGPGISHDTMVSGVVWGRAPATAPAARSRDAVGHDMPRPLRACSVGVSLWYVSTGTLERRCAAGRGAREGRRGRRGGASAERAVVRRCRIAFPSGGGAKTGAGPATAMARAVAAAYTARACMPRTTARGGHRAAAGPVLPIFSSCGKNESLAWPEHGQFWLSFDQILADICRTRPTLARKQASCCALARRPDLAPMCRNDKHTESNTRRARGGWPE